MTSVEEPKTNGGAPARPGLLHSVLSKIIRPKPTGVSCEYCGWNGTPDQVVKSPRLNEDGIAYQIQSCPKCARNGGLIFHQA